MTDVNLYEDLLQEIDKVKAPDIYLDGFNFFANKAIIEYINSRYNVFDTKQQTTDDLRFWFKSVYIDNLGNITDVLGNNLGVTVVNSTSKGYAILLPSDYTHLLKCVIFDKKCKKYFACKKLTSDLEAGTTSNYYYKPKFKNPYFKINKNLIEIINNDSVIDKFEIDYLVKHQQINLIDITKPTQLEFDGYVYYEILNQLIKLVLENNSDVRLQTNIPINQTII